MKGQSEKIAFFVAVIIAGLCSLIYELLISTTSSYFLGDSVKQFSLTIGVYMAAMGLGSYLTKFIQKDLLDWFVKVEILLGLVGGMSIPILYLVFDQLSTWQYELVMLSITFMIGVLTGFEVPILVRILKTYYPLKSNLAYVLSLDYLGALIATLLFPFLLLPFVGTFQTSILFGMLNVLLGFWIYRFFTRKLSVEKKNWLQVVALVCLLFFLILLSFSSRLLSHWEDGFYSHQIIHSEQTPYQKLVITKNRDDMKLFINRIIQFSSADEYRYHEALAVLPLELSTQRKSVLILGGGEGLLAREVLKYADVERLTIVDLDGAVFELARNNPRVRKLNENALYDPRVELVSQDAMVFLKEQDQEFDLILADLPDPSNESLARLYSTTFYRLARERLRNGGLFVTQATGTFHTTKAFWGIYETLVNSGFDHVYPYHVYVPSFGDWGFHLAAAQPLNPLTIEPPTTCRYLDREILPHLFTFEKDIRNPGNLEANRLDQPSLLAYFLEDWEKFRKEKIH